MSHDNFIRGQSRESQSDDVGQWDTQMIPTRGLGMAEMCDWKLASGQNCFSMS